MLSSHKYNVWIYVNIFIYSLNSLKIWSIYRQTSDIMRTIVGNNNVDHADVVGASPVGAAPTTSSLSTYTWRQYPAYCREKKFVDLVRLISEIWQYLL